MVSKHSRHFFGGGFFTLLILSVVFLGALVITGGLLPSKRKPPPSNYKIGELDIPPGSSSQFNLQLNTLKFKNVTPPVLPTTSPIPDVTQAPPLPTPTPPCAQTITLDFLLDISSSMNRPTPSGATKISRLKEAVLAIVQDLSDNSIIGIQTFNSNIISNPGQMDVIPISYYREIKNNIGNKVNPLNASGTTPTHDALVFSFGKLQDALPNFPSRKFNFILISDGNPVPASQNPRSKTPNPADQIKNLPNIEKVYTVGVYDAAQAGNPALSDLLKSIASSPSNYYEAQSADQIQALLSAIKTDVCN